MKRKEKHWIFLNIFLAWILFMSFPYDVQFENENNLFKFKKKFTEDKLSLIVE